VYGTAGTGKSWLIATIRQIIHDRRETLLASKPSDPEIDTLGLKVTATTGIAGVNVKGSTIQGPARINNFQRHELEGTPLGKFEEEWRGTRWLVVDEISMMGQSQWGWLSRRMKQLCKDPHSLGTMNVIIFGDHGQLPPINGYLGSTAVPWLGDPNYRALRIEGRAAYFSFKNIIELKTIKRLDSKDPNAERFRQALLQLRESKVSVANRKWLMQRQIRLLDPEEQREFRRDAIRLYHSNDEKDLHNLHALVHNGEPFTVLRGDHSTASARRRKPNEFHGVPAELYVAEKAKVILRTNEWTEMGLANGARGTVREILYTKEQTPGKDLPVILVEFPSYRGPRFSEKCDPKVVPIVPVKITKQKIGWRYNLPLDLAWALTVHKSQGLTLDKVYYMLDTHDPNPGQTFVAMSRVKRYTDLCLSDTYDLRLANLNRSKPKKQKLGSVFASWGDRIKELARITRVAKRCSERRQKRQKQTKKMMQPKKDEE
jgi:ATP-dependent exoDNAse (exonuclease V) alpha subunit